MLHDVSIDRVDHVWSTDITYVGLPGGFMYLAAVVDWHSRFVLRGKLSNTLDGSFCLELLREVLASGKLGVFDTDQGVQFTASAFTGSLAEAGVVINMDGRGRCQDKISVERLWRSVKYEDLFIRGYAVVAELRAGLARYFVFYNLRFASVEGCFRESASDPVLRVRR